MVERLIFDYTFFLQVLKVFHYPTTVTLVQFAVGSLLVLFMWTFNLYKRPRVSGAQVIVIIQEIFYWQSYWL